MATVNIDIDQGTVTLRGAFPPVDERPARAWPMVVSAGFGDMRRPVGVSTDRSGGNQTSLDQEPTCLSTCPFRRADTLNRMTSRPAPSAPPIPTRRSPAPSSTTWRAGLRPTVIAPLDRGHPPYRIRAGGCSSTLHDRCRRALGLGALTSLASMIWLDGRHWLIYAGLGIVVGVPTG